MTAATMTLADFLLARIAEDEELAHHARGLLGIETQWHTVDELRARGLTIADARHVERWSSARVLAECEAKRRIVDLHDDDKHLCVRDWDWDQDYEVGGYSGTPKTGSVVNDGVRLEGCQTMQFLALPYADHPDYRRDKWRP